MPQLPAGPLGGMPNPPPQFQQQAIPQLPTDSSNKNRMKLWIILGSSILFVIILAIGFFAFSGDDTKNELANDQSSNQSPSETSTASNGTTSQQNENKQVASISKLPTNPSDVMERLARALILAETSIDDAMKMLEPCIPNEQDLEKIAGHFLTDQSELPEAKRTLSKSELLADIKQSFRTRVLESLKRQIEREIRSGESIHTQSWAHQVLSSVSWSDMEYVTSIYSLRRRTDDVGGGNYYSAVAILENEGTFFCITMGSVYEYDLLSEKCYLEDDFKSFCLTSAYALNVNWRKEWLDELRSRKNPELAPLIAIVESKPFYADLTVEQSSALSDARPKPSKNDILKAIEITRTQKLEKISINEFAVDKEILEKIVSVESLKDLSIRRGQLTDNDMILLLGCKSLTRLSLAHNLITPKSTDLLSKYSNLDFLYLVGNPICDSDASKAALNKAYPDANIFFE